MANIKSSPCKHFLWLMDLDEDANYTANLEAVIADYAKNGITIDREKLEAEIAEYM